MIDKTFRNRRAMTTVELALTLPILFLLLFGGFELSRAYMIMHTCEAAAYEGARVGIVPGATAAEVQAAANQVLASVGVNNASVTVTPTDLNVVSESVAATITVRFSDNSILAPLFMGTTQFVRTCELIREVP